jgi:uncharacterized protein (UPF0335 family)
MKLDDQYEQTRHSLRRTKPRSKATDDYRAESSPHPDQTDQAGTQGEVEMSETAETGHNSNEQLKSIVERIERLEEEKAERASDIKDVYAESKSNGYDVKALRTIIRLRKQDPDDRQEAENILETYMHALGMV